MTNYFNKLSPEEKLIQLGKCRFMDSSEFYNGVSFLIDKKIKLENCLNLIDHLLERALLE